MKGSTQITDGFSINIRQYFYRKIFRSVRNKDTNKEIVKIIIKDQG